MTGWGEVIEPEGGLDRLALGKIAGQDDILPVKREDESARPKGSYRTAADRQI